MCRIYTTSHNYESASLPLRLNTRYIDYSDLPSFRCHFWKKDDFTSISVTYLFIFTRFRFPANIFLRAENAKKVAEGQIRRSRWRRKTLRHRVPDELFT